MREKRLSRRTIVYAILLVAVFLLLALVVSGCGTTQSDDKVRYAVSANHLVLSFAEYKGDTIPDTGKRIPCQVPHSLCPICAGGRCAHGRGVFEVEEGMWYKGDFRYGVMHGNGRYKDDDLNLYVGSFRYGFPNGPGTLFCYNGRKYKGIFSGRRMVGTGTSSIMGGEGPCEP